MRTKIQQTTLVNLLHERAQTEATKTAFIFLKDGETESSRINYQELDEKARAIANKLHSFNAASNGVLLLYQPGLEFVTAFLGCLYAGAIAIPAYPPQSNRKLSRLLGILVDAQPKVILTTNTLLCTVKEWLNQAQEKESWHLVATNNISKQLSLDWQEPLLNNETLAFLQYTSGSTGTPKGVMVSHENLMHNLKCIKTVSELTSKSVSVSWLPSFHDMGLIDGILQPLYSGFLGVLMPPTYFLQRPIRWLQAISDYQATHCGGPNFAYDHCVRRVGTEQLSSLDLSSWRSAYNGAEPIHREVMEKFAAKFQNCGFQAKSFCPCYGMAEATLMISGVSVSDEPVYYEAVTNSQKYNQIIPNNKNSQTVKSIVSCGKTWLDTKVVIVDPQSLKQLPSNQIGEIWVSGSSVAKGYWNLTKETRETFRACLADTLTKEGPFLRTGDLGFIQDDELFVTGRLKDLIIIRGRNYYPQDIERTVEKSHFALRANCSAAFSISIDEQEKLVVVQEVERIYLRNLNLVEVIGNIREAIALEHDLQVHDIILIKPASIHKTSSGKIQRYLCRSSYLNGSLKILNNS